MAAQTAPNEAQAARQEVAESKLDLLTQQMQLLEQEKDEWKRQVGSMQAEHHPASWLRRASLVDPRDRLVHCLTQVVTFL